MRFKIPGKREDNMTPMRTLLLFIGLGLLASVSAAHAQQTPQPPAQPAAQPPAQPAARAFASYRAYDDPIILAMMAGDNSRYIGHAINPVEGNVTGGVGKESVAAGTEGRRDE